MKTRLPILPAIVSLASSVPYQLCLATLLSFLMPTMAAGQRATSLTGATTIQSADDVVAKWQPDRHLYVKGNVGVNPRLLDDLEVWLDENGPHWTVVLMSDAENEFKAGTNYRGMDAVEQILGKGLNNQTDFINLRHPKTGENDGTILVIFLKERKFSYFGSEAQNRRGLDREHWPGKLDQPARRAMVRGGDIINAVRDTVKSINGQLESMIRTEAEDAERAAKESQRLLANLHAAIEHARQQLDSVKIAAAKLRDQFPTAKGSLANPPLESWRGQLDTIAEGASANTVRTSQQQLAATEEAIANYLNAFAVNDALPTQVEKLHKALTPLESAPNRVADSAVTAVKQWISEAQNAAAAGEFGVSTLLEKAEAALDQGNNALQIELNRIERAQALNRTMRQALLGGSGFALLVVAGVLGFLNRRRKPFLEAAQATIEERKQVINRETEGVDRLFTRNDEILGTREKLAQRGYTGATKALSEQAINDVDDLFIIAKEVRRVLREAEELVQPTGLWPKIINLISSTRYQQAIQLVTGKPLKFTRISGLPRALQRRNTAPQLGGQTTATVADNDEITVTFEDVLTDFKNRSQSAESALNTFEHCLAEIQDALTSAQTDVSGLFELEKRLDAQSDEDGYFALPSFIGKLLPSINDDLRTADEMATFDAVGAMQNALPIIQRKVKETRALASVIASARGKWIPQVKQAAAKLNSLQFECSWIDAALHTLGSQADGLIAEASEKSVSEQIQSIETRLSELTIQAEESVKVGQSIRDHWQPTRDSLLGKIESTRQALAEKLSLPTTAVLTEVNVNPMQFWTSAGKNLDAASVALTLGQVAAANAAIDAMQLDANKVEYILAESLTATERFDQDRNSIQQRLRLLGDRLPTVAQNLENVRSRFVAATLTLPADAANQQATQVSELVQQASLPIHGVPPNLMSAGEQHKAGRVLAAANALAEAKNQVETAHANLDRVESYLQLIEAKVQENSQVVNRLNQQTETLRENARDPLVTQASIDALYAVSRELNRLEQALKSPQAVPNPFEVGSALTALQNQLTGIESRFVADRQAHAESSRAVTGATRQLQLAQQLMRQSQTDNIPDSPKTRQLNERISVLSQAILATENELRQPHGDWKRVDADASRLQTELSSVTDSLGGELQTAGQALALFQQASQSVFQATQWSGSYGVRVSGSPGVQELERARTSLQQGNYGIVLELSRVAAAAATAAIQHAEREVQRRRMAEEMEAEAARRRRAARTIGGGSVIIGGGLGTGLPPTFGGGTFGGGSSGGFSAGPSTSSSPHENDSGFGRSGW